LNSTILELGALVLGHKANTLRSGTEFSSVRTYPLTFRCAAFVLVANGVIKTTISQQLNLPMDPALYAIILPTPIETLFLLAIFSRT
jgi:hypothetical protein